MQIDSVDVVFALECTIFYSERKPLSTAESERFCKSLCFGLVYKPLICLFDGARENNLTLNLLIFSAVTSGKAKQTKWPNHPQSGTPPNSVSSIQALLFCPKNIVKHLSLFECLDPLLRWIVHLSVWWIMNSGICFRYKIYEDNNSLWH